MNKTLLALLCATCLTTPFAFAGAGHDHGPKHGGLVREAGAITYELVAKSDVLTLHVSEHGKPVPTQGAKATLMLIAGNDRTTIALEPADENRMVAKGNFKIGVGVRAALTVTLAGKDEAKVNFNLK